MMGSPNLAVVRELCETSRVLQETFARLNECETSSAHTQALVVQLAAQTQAMRTELEARQADLDRVTGDYEVLKLLMTVSMGPGSEKKTDTFEEYQP
jgi:multidrug resistance efflux pump